MNGHSRMSCGNETHFFEGLGGVVADYLTERRYWPRRACEYMASLKHVGQCLFDLYGIHLDDYSKMLARERPCISAMLACFMNLYLWQTGKRRWLEKTPGHLKEFIRIRTCFPKSHVICIVRDPRDVALSLMQVPWGVSEFIDGLLIWKSYCVYYKRLIAKDETVLTIRFEDLVSDPTSILTNICEMIGEAFEPAMLNTSESAVGVGGTMETYKHNVSRPADPARAYAWKRSCGDQEMSLADQILRRDLPVFGYACLPRKYAKCQNTQIVMT